MRKTQPGDPLEWKERIPAHRIWSGEVGHGEADGILFDECNRLRRAEGMLPIASMDDTLYPDDATTSADVPQEPSTFVCVADIVSEHDEFDEYERDIDAPEPPPRGVPLVLVADGGSRVRTPNAQTSQPESKPQKDEEDIVIEPHHSTRPLEKMNNASGRWKRGKAKIVPQ